MTNAQLLASLHDFVDDEQAANQHKLLEIWEKPLPGKLRQGLSQAFTHIERGENPSTIWAHLAADDANESRFREGDLLFLHGGCPLTEPYGRGFSFELEEDDRWLLRGNKVAQVLAQCQSRPCYADPDTLDLTPFFKRALDEIAASEIGLAIVLPLLGGHLTITFDDRDVAEGERRALEKNLNAEQAAAVGLAFGAEQVACIQGPPGTGKTRVLAVIARLMVERGERVLVTSHTHTAINNALNKIHAPGVPTVKVGDKPQARGLHGDIHNVAKLDDWQERPTNGYVVGATAFATCSSRLENYVFDTVIFDEASQITLPLAIMAMRVARRFIFIGDHKQLPPVMLSRSILGYDAPSAFATITSHDADHNIMLSKTYRMNQWLTDWPSETYYAGKLIATGENSNRKLALNNISAKFAAVFDTSASGVFIPNLDRASRTVNFREARLVADLCEAAVNAGVAHQDIGVVTPYRLQGRAIRNQLTLRFGRAQARMVTADTVERMQGQERELIILSLATGDEMFLNVIAAFFFQPERLNVSITRAMTKLIVIGPDIGLLPTTENDIVNGWVKQYRDFINQLKRVPL